MLPLAERIADRARRAALEGVIPGAARDDLQRAAEQMVVAKDAEAGVASAPLASLAAKKNKIVAKAVSTSPFGAKK